MFKDTEKTKVMIQGAYFHFRHMDLGVLVYT